MSQGHFEVYLKGGCPYSQAASDELRRRKLPAQEMVVPDAQLDEVKRAHHMPTFPQIFWVDPQKGKKLVGGYDDLMNYLATRGK